MSHHVTKVIPIEGPRRKRCDEPRTECSVLGCANATNNRKPYCIDHLDRLPYVQKIKAELIEQGELEPVAGFDQAPALEAERVAG